MSELREVMARAMAAQGKVDPDEVFSLVETIDADAGHEPPPVDPGQEAFALEFENSEVGDLYQPAAALTSEQLDLDAVTGEGRDHQLARNSDPRTSEAADEALRAREGEANVIRRGTHRHAALECFVQNGPLIAEDVKVMLGIDGIWKRVSDLKNGGFITETGFTRRSREGRDADIYEVTQRGRAAYETLGQFRPHA